MADANAWMRCPERPLSPPDPNPECPECDVPLEIVTRDYVKCGECGFEEEAYFDDGI